MKLAGEHLAEIEENEVAGEPLAEMGENEVAGEPFAEMEEARRIGVVSLVTISEIDKGICGNVNLLITSF